MKVLHVAAEAFPLIKTGGLGDVAYALPRAERALGMSVRLLLPGYASVLSGLTHLKRVADIGSVFGAANVRLLLGKLPRVGTDVYVIDSPSLFGRNGNPYLGPDGREWNDTHRRCGLLGWTGARIADGDLDRTWKPDIVHSHDWHAGLTAAYLAENPAHTAKSVFTIHNLAFRGLFPFGESDDLGFSRRMGFPHQFEFFGNFSFLKAGLVFSDKITTVSPTYAREVLTDAMGFGMQGVLKNRSKDFSGILNGLDYDIWNPKTDVQLVARYDSDDISGKAQCKKDLQKTFGLDENAKGPLFGVVSRLADQKGLDLVLASLGQILSLDGQLVVLGSGEPTLESSFRHVAQTHKGHVACYIGYDEVLSHRLVAGSDALLVPSRFEPCGLTQIMALRYGTLPVARRTGGLADTITPIAGDTGDGYLFDDPSPEALCAALRDATSLYADKAAWNRAVKRAMVKDFSWEKSANAYTALYKSLTGS